jgi:hypothetical protein
LLVELLLDRVNQTRYRHLEPEVKLMNQKMKFPGFAVALVLLTASSGLVVGQQVKSTLNDRARKTGGKLVWRYRAPRSVIYPNVEELAKRSDLILVGKALAHRSNLREDGKFMTNDFLVRVQEVLKGDAPVGGSTVISIPGGARKFADGSFAALLPANFKAVENGGIYVFFLEDKKKKASPYAGHMLVSETQGLFEVRDGRVEPADSVDSDPVVKKYRGMGASNFFAQIRSAVPKKKTK